MGRFALSVTLAALVLAGSSSASAWDGALCALDERMTVAPALLCDEVDGPPMCASGAIDAPLVVPSIAGSARSGDEARLALARARELLESDEPGLAIFQLSFVDEVFPGLADRTALLRGEALLRAGQPAEAKRAFEVARESIETRVATLARVGRVRALIAMDSRDAGTELIALMRRYPELPQALELRLLLAERREAHGNVNEAVRVYREIDLTSPGSPVAARARARLAAMTANGVAVRELNVIQRVERAERLVRDGPMTEARREIGALLGERLTPDLRGRVALGASRLARVEGRWDDAQRFALMARGAAASANTDAELRERSEEQASDLDRAARAREQEAARAGIARMKGRGPWTRVPTLRLRAIVDIAARTGLTEELDGALGALAPRSDFVGIGRFETAVLASGVGDDALVERLFAGVVTHPSLGVASRYHRARALERLGRWVEAEVEYLRVGDLDRSETRWYALLAEQRLWTVHEAMLCHCMPDETAAPSHAVLAERTRPEEGQPLVLAALAGIADPSAQPNAPARREGMREEPVERDQAYDADGGGRGRRGRDAPDFDALAAALGPVIEAHGEALPWIARTRDLLLLGDANGAADELHEAYLAWRDARGQGLRRVGIDAVYRGAEAPRRFPADFRTRRERRTLESATLRTLADVASALDDQGTAVGFGGWSRVAARPRAYESLVRQVAARHGLDPNLLLAVMRVESVYQRRIVSYAGAVGLMQIMPRTGRLIASSLERDDYTTEDLLDPAVNLEFAAWYLASLIERFDGRLPLAIASYNGGPHNVRRWMRDHAETMTLDAFLERIPFEQTHRYVRRVLGHYAAYRAQENLPMERLSMVLPEVGPDPVGF